MNRSLFTGHDMPTTLKRLFGRVARYRDAVNSYNENTAQLRALHKKYQVLLSNDPSERLVATAALALKGYPAVPRPVLDIVGEINAETYNALAGNSAMIEVFDFKVFCTSPGCDTYRLCSGRLLSERMCRRCRRRTRRAQHDAGYESFEE